MATHDLRRESQPFFDPVLDEQNDRSLGVVTDDDENEEGVASLGIIQLKGMARELEAGCKAMHQVQIRSKQTLPHEPVPVVRSKYS